MGMGEPLLNLRAVLAAVRFLNAAVGIGARHITISTVGVPQAIVRLAGHRLQATLAVSIHAPSQALREQLIPRCPPPHACSCAACQQRAACSPPVQSFPGSCVCLSPQGCSCASETLCPAQRQGVPAGGADGGLQRVLPLDRAARHL